jgi:HPt (histidine-containing phosphotransfer) domain-containing protein
MKTENTTTTEKAIDLSYLSDTMGGNKKLIREVMDVFLKQAPEELAKLNKAVEAKDYATIKNLSHTMKSSTSIMGISSLTGVLKEMEELAKDSANIERIKVLNEAINSICKQAIEEVEMEKLNYG